MGFHEKKPQLVLNFFLVWVKHLMFNWEDISYMCVGVYAVFNMIQMCNYIWTVRHSHDMAQVF